MKTFNEYLEQAQEEDDDIGYFDISDGEHTATLMVSKDSGEWKEKIVAGSMPSFNKARYQSYLTMADIKQWLKKDFDQVTYLGSSLNDEEEYDEEMGTGNVGGESAGTQSDDITGVNMPLFGKKKKGKLVSRKAVKYQKPEKFGGWGKYINVPEEVEK